MPNNILITGMPKSGKSTLIKNIIANLPNTVGCIATEVKKDNERIGFDIVTSANTHATLARIGLDTPHQVSKYSVDIDSMETVLDDIQEFSDDDILYLDEIGQMQMYSDKFKSLTQKYLDAKNICIALVSQVYEDDFIRRVKSRPDTVIYHLTHENREDIYTAVTQAIVGIQKKIKKSKKYIQEPERFDIHDTKATMTSTHDTRILVLKNDHWHCSCNFFEKHHTCSHSMALRKILQK